MLRGRLVAATPDDPVIVVSMRKVFQCAIEVVDGCESLEPKQQLLECSNKSLNTTIAIGTSNKGRTRLNAKESQLVLKRMQDALTSVNVPQRRANQQHRRFFRSVPRMVLLAAARRSQSLLRI